MENMTSLALKFDNSRLLVLDQQKLPHEEVWVECRTPEDMIRCIRALKVRGAPLIGVAAAMSLAQAAEAGARGEKLKSIAMALRESRPTAVNLMIAIDRALASPNVVKEAQAIFAEDVRLCDSIANHGETLINDGDQILTHCNTGGLATAGVGTALGIIRRAHENGKRLHVFVDETRPLLQGARLTAWELEKLKIPYTLICDNMAPFLMAQGKITKIFVGCDRIAVNGDFANKVGTYGVAVSAKHHGIPFYVAAPWTTVDRDCPNGAAIPIEERGSDEVRAGFSPKACQVYNPAFDVTPADLVTAFVLDRGIFKSSLIQELIAGGR